MIGGRGVKGATFGPATVLHIGMRATFVVALLVLGGLLAPPAQARLVYVKRAASAAPVVYTATDAGKRPRRVGIGRAPTVSPDGRWIAYVTVPRGSSDPEQVMLIPVDGGAARLLMRGRSVTSLTFGPDSRRVAAVVNQRRVRMYDIAEDTLVSAARGWIRGFSFSPDGTQIAFGVATNRATGAPSDVYVAPVDDSVERKRITTTGDALNPVWGPREVVFDRQRRRRRQPPAYNLWATDPSGTQEARRLTALTIPPLVSGLVPVELSAGGRRLLAVFTGQDTSVGFTVSTVSGRTRALSRDFESGLVGFDLTADGRAILAHTGGPDPSNAHDVVRVPYRGGEPTVLVDNAAFPDWNR
jgi:dipeptidyl aminopeptidase/acylaminoacyl peptidase